MTKAINRRLGRLEDRLGLGPETEDDRRLRERLQNARRRIAGWRASQGLSPDERQREDLSGLTIVEILHRGRARARACAWG
jgi:hypothetical protein